MYWQVHFYCSKRYKGRTKCKELTALNSYTRFRLFCKFCAHLIEAALNTCWGFRVEGIYKRWQFVSLTTWHLCHEYDDFSFQLISGGVSQSRNICHHHCIAYRFLTTNVPIRTLIIRASHQAVIHSIHCCMLRTIPVADQYLAIYGVD